MLVCFFIPVDYGANRAAWQATQDVFHLSVFTLFGLWMFQLLRVNGVRSALLMAATVCLTLIVAIELVQPSFGRTSSAQDVAVGATGAGMALLFSYYRATSMSLWRKTAPAVTPSMRSALSDLKLTEFYVVHAGNATLPLSREIRAVAIQELLGTLGPLR